MLFYDTKLCYKTALMKQILAETDILRTETPLSAYEDGFVNNIFSDFQQYDVEWT